MAKFNKSPKYWSSRMDEIMAYVDRTDIDFFDELQTVYTEARQNIQKEIYNFYAKYSKENNISMQEAKKRLMREDLSDYRANAEKYFKQAEKDPDLLKRLNEQYKAGKVTRLEALYLDLEWQLGKMSGSLHQSFDRYLKEVAQYAYRKIAGGNSKSTLNKPALEQIVKTPFNGKNYSSSIWGNTEDLAKDLKKVLTQGFVRGSGPTDIARELRKKYNVAKSRAEAIVRTDGTNIINLSAAKRFEEFGLTRYKNNVHVDSRTTDICLQINREDKSYLLSEYEPGVTAPPYHVGCRTGIVPDDDEIGYKDNDDDEDTDVVYDIIKSNMDATNMSEMVGKKHYDGFMEHLKNVNNPKLTKLYEKLGDKLEYFPVKNGTAFARGNKVQLNPASFESNKYGPKFRTVYHENAHAFDSLGLERLNEETRIKIGTKKVKVGKKTVEVDDYLFITHASGLPKYNLKEIIKKDLWEYVNGDLPRYEDLGKRPRKKTEKEAYDALSSKIYSESFKNFSEFRKKMAEEAKANPSVYLNVSDICEGTGYVSRFGEGGHDSRYWQRNGNLETEFFAEVTDSLATNKESYKKMKEIFPNAIKVWEQIIDDILKGSD